MRGLRPETAPRAAAEKERRRRLGGYLRDNGNAYLQTAAPWTKGRKTGAGSAAMDRGERTAAARPGCDTSLRRLKGRSLQASIRGKYRRQLFHILQRPAAAAYHAGQRIVGDDDRQARFLHEQAVDIAQQRSAAGQHHATFGDVGTKLGRSALQRRLDGGHDTVERIGQRFENFVR